MTSLLEGAKAPDFTGTNAKGQTVSLSTLRGKNVVLYFYPKDDTPGCTIEAKEFTENIAAFADNKTVVLGVSYDDGTCHQNFIEKYQLAVDLLSDPAHEIAKAYGSAGDKYPQRNTFVINKEGVLKKIFTNVNPKGHAKEVLAALLQS